MSLPRLKIGKKRLIKRWKLLIVVLRGQRKNSGKPQKSDDESGAKKGGMVSSASKRADGCAKRGKTKGRMV
jgi:hypothetical protein